MDVWKALKINLFIFILISAVLAIGAEFYFWLTISSSFWSRAIENNELGTMAFLFFKPWYGFPFFFVASYLKLKKQKVRVKVHITSKLTGLKTAGCSLRSILAHYF